MNYFLRSYFIRIKRRETTPRRLFRWLHSWWVKAKGFLINAMLHL